MKLGDFINQVCSAPYHAEVKDMKGASLAARGGLLVLRLVVRTDSEGKRHVLRIPPRMNPDTEMTDSVLRSHCNQLGIEPADFGIAEEDESED